MQKLMEQDKVTSRDRNASGRLESEKEAPWGKLAAEEKEVLGPHLTPNPTL